jgi:hypothetical protein
MWCLGLAAAGRVCDDVSQLRNQEELVFKLAQLNTGIDWKYCSLSDLALK